MVSADGSGARNYEEVDHALLACVEPDGQYHRPPVRPCSAENYLTNVPLVYPNGGSGVQMFPTMTTQGDEHRRGLSPDGAPCTSALTVADTPVRISVRTRSSPSIGKRAERTLTAAAGGAIRPITSPDGKWLVYASRAGTRTALRIRDLATHEDNWLVAETQRDDAEGYAPNDVFPGYAFTPDSRAVVFYGGGKIKRVDLGTRRVEVIPFSAHVELGMGERLKVPLNERWTDRGDAASSVTESPDGRRVAFRRRRLWPADRSGDAVGAASPTRRAAREFSPRFPTGSG
jgi:hypothetical protein